MKENIQSFLTIRAFKHVLNVIAINETRTLTKQYQAILNVRLIAKDPTRIKGEQTISVSVSVQIQKSIVCARKVIFGILQNVVAKMVSILEVLLTIR